MELIWTEFSSPRLSPDFNVSSSLIYILINEAILCYSSPNLNQPQLISSQINSPQIISPQINSAQSNSTPLNWETDVIVSCSLFKADWFLCLNVTSCSTLCFLRWRTRCACSSCWVWRRWLWRTPREAWTAALTWVISCWSETTSTCQASPGRTRCVGTTMRGRTNHTHDFFCHLMLPTQYFYIHVLFHTVSNVTALNHMRHYAIDWDDF